jgi:hypothetical protein
MQLFQDHCKEQLMLIERKDLTIAPNWGLTQVLLMLIRFIYRVQRKNKYSWKLKKMQNQKILESWKI